MGITDLPLVRRISSGIYEVALSTDFSNFGLMHGGYLGAVICKAATTYIQEEEKLNLPHTFNFHLEFLRPCRPATATIEIETIRRGYGLATVQATLRQESKKAVTGFVTNVDLNRQEGLSFPSALRLHPPPRPADVAEFDSDSSNGWLPVVFSVGTPKMQPNMSHWQRMVHKDNFDDPSLTDHWVAWKYPGEMWTNEWLPHLADNNLNTAENYQPNGGTGIKIFMEIAQKVRSGEWGPDYIPMWNSKYWYPTLNLRLEVKKLIPPATRWLFMRAQIKKISNSRFGTEILILDKDWELVAVAHDVTLIKDVEWKTRAQKSKGEPVNGKL